MAIFLQYAWLIPALPLASAALGALTPRGGRAVASGAAFLLAQLLDIAVFQRLRHLAWWRAQEQAAA